MKPLPSFCYASFSCMHFSFIVVAMNMTPLKLPCVYHFDNRFHSTFNPLMLKDDYIHCYVEKTQCHLKSSAKNRQSNGQPFKSWVFCRVQWAYNLVAKGLFFFHLLLHWNQITCCSEGTLVFWWAEIFLRADSFNSLWISNIEFPWMVGNPDVHSVLMNDVCCNADFSNYFNQCLDWLSHIVFIPALKCH